MVIWAVRPVIDEVIQSLLAETDIELARSGLEVDLKMLEGLIRTRPEDRRLLVLAAQGFTGYAMMFLEDEAPQRARLIYERGRIYGIRALSLSVGDFAKDDLTLAEFNTAIKRLGKKDIPAAYWTAAAWAGRINLERTDTKSLAESSRTTALMAWVEEKEPGFYYSGPLWFFGTYYASLPPMLGGNPDLACRYFERAVDEDGDHFLWGKLLYARYYAVQTLDRELFESLLVDIIEGSDNEPDNLKLLNRIAAVKAEELLKRVDEFF